MIGWTVFVGSCAEIAEAQPALYAAAAAARRCRRASQPAGAEQPEKLVDDGLQDVTGRAAR